MSRLDSFIRRMAAQRDVLNYLGQLLAELPGPIFELGLGNGRTFDHLRERFPGRRIVAFDRVLAAHPASTPGTDDLILGEIQVTAEPFVGSGGVLAHADIGTGTVEGDARLATWLPGLMAGLLAPGGVAVSSSPIDHPALPPLALPPGIPPERYFLYRKIEA